MYFSGVIGWSQTLPSGVVPYTSSYCTSMEMFQDYLVGKKATSIVIGAGSTFYSCTDRITARKIIDSFSRCKSTTCTNQSFPCNGLEWHVGRCKKGSEIVVGSEICSCSGDLSIRPCTGNNDWGGAGPNTCGQNNQTLSITVNYSGT